MKQIGKRTLALLLTVLLLFGCMDVRVFAAGATQLTSSTGNSDGVVYQLKRTTSFEVGEQYIFIAGTQPSSQYLTELPDGAGILKVVSQSDISWEAYNKNSVTAYVDVIRATDGFDSCKHGTLNYNATEYNCWAGGAQHVTGAAYSYVEFPYGSQVTVTLMKDGAAWSSQTVALYQGVSKVKEVATDASGVYNLGYQANGSYAIYVNSQYAESITVNAKPNGATAGVPGGKEDGRFQYITSTTFSTTLNYYTLTAHTTLNHDQGDASANDSGEPGILVLQDGDGKILTSGTEGTVSRVVKDNVIQYDVLVGGADTGHDIGNGTATTKTGERSNEIETVRFYKLKLDLTSDTRWTNALVTLRDAQGNLKQILSYDESLSSGNTAAYTAIMQEDEGAAKETYYVYVDGQDVHQTLQRVAGKYEAAAAFYTAEITVKQDGAVKTDAEISLDNGVEHYVMEHSGSGVYTAHVLVNQDESGNERSYAVAVEGVIDESADTQTVTSAGEALSFDYYSVLYYTVEKASATEYTKRAASYRTQIVRKGSRTYAPSDAYVEGLSFSWYSATPWDQTSEKVNDEFDYAGTPITAKTELYAQFGTPAVKINDYVRTDAGGEIDGSGQYFRMANLSISGFGNESNIIKSAQMTMKNVDQVQFLSTENMTITQGNGLPLGSGDVATSTVVTITFKNGAGVSMGEAQDWLRANVVVKPTQNQECQVKIEVSDGVIAPGASNTFTAAESTGMTRLGGSTKGAALSSGVYYVDSNVTYSNSTAGGSGISIAGGATVYLYVKKGVTLTATGGNGSGRTGGGAGINVPSNSTLVLLGQGTVKATGGRAGNGSNGARGGDGVLNNGTNYRGGYGASGGAGGGGAGAGIGGSGGTGGTGGGQTSNGSNKTSGSSNASGSDGNGGGAGGTGGSCGTVYILGSLTVNAASGGSGSGGSGGSGGTTQKSDSKWDGKKYHTAGAGGGGGGGGGGYTASAIGGGGAGGGGGGSGGQGGTDFTKSTDYKSARTATTRGGGGNGGAGASWGGSGGDDRDEGKYSGSWEKTGGNGGSGGGAGSRGNDGTSYYAKTATVNGSKGSSTASKAYTGYTIKFPGASSGASVSYTFGTAKTVTVPDYSVGKGNYFLGWQVKSYGHSIENSGKDPLTSAETTIYQPGETITLSASTCGNIVMEPLVKAKNGISADDTMKVKFTSSMAAVTYHTYSAQTYLDGTPTDMGLMTVSGGSKTYTLSAGTDATYSMTVAADETFSVTRIDTVTVTGKAAAKDSDSPTRVDFESVNVQVDGYVPQTLTLKNGSADGPAMSLVSDSGGSALYQNIRLAAGGGAAVTYDTYIDGSAVATLESTESGAANKNARYGATVYVRYSTVTVNVIGNTAVDLIELRPASGTGASRIIPVETGDSDSAGSLVQTFAESRLTEGADAVEYTLYLNGINTGKTAKFDGNQTILAPLYTMTIYTTVDGALSDVGAVNLGENAIRESAGVYKYVTTSALSNLLTVGNKAIGRVLPSASEQTLDFFTVSYLTEAGGDAIPDKDNGIYFDGDTITVQDGVGTAAVSDFTFGGWSDGTSAYAVGETYTVSGKTTFTPVWTANSKMEARWVVGGQTYYGTLAQALAAANAAVTDSEYSVTIGSETTTYNIPVGQTIQIYVQNPAALSESATLPKNATLTVEEGSTLTVASGTTLENYGTLVNDGGLTVDNGGIVYNHFVPMLDSDGKVKTTNTETVTLDADGNETTVTTTTVVGAGGTFDNEAALTVNDGGLIINEGAYSNTGTASIASGGLENNGGGEVEGPGGTLPDGLGGGAKIETDGDGTIRITLTSDVKLTEPLTISDGQKVILDLNGHTLTGPSDGSVLTVAGDTTDLTIVDTAGGGEIVGGAGTASDSAPGDGGIGIEIKGGSVYVAGPVVVRGGKGSLGSDDGPADGGAGGIGAVVSGGTLTVEYGAHIIGGDGGDSETIGGTGKGGDGGLGAKATGGIIDNEGDIHGGKAGKSYQYSGPTVSGDEPPTITKNDPTAGSGGDGSAGASTSITAPAMLEGGGESRNLLPAANFSFEKNYYVYQETINGGTRTPVEQKPTVSFASTALESLTDAQKTALGTVTVAYYRTKDADGTAVEPAEATAVPSQPGTYEIRVTTAGGTGEDAYRPVTGLVIGSYAIVKADPKLSAWLTDSGLKLNTNQVGDETITYTVSDESVIGLNESTGTITPQAAGTATIKVAVEENEHYLAGSVSIGLTITGSEGSFSVNEVVYNVIYGDPAFPVENATGVKDGADAVTVNSGEVTIVKAGQAVLEGTAFTGAVKVVVAEKPVTITPNDVTITYGDAAPASFAYHVAGLVGGDTLDGVTVTHNATPEGSGKLPAGTYELTAAMSGTNANYSITSKTGTLTVLPKAVTVSGIKIQTKTYDGTTSASLNVSDVKIIDESGQAVTGLTVAAKDSAAIVFADADAGGAKVISLQDSDGAFLYTLGNNYTVSAGSQSVAYGAITPAPITTVAPSESEYSGQPQTPAPAVKAGEMEATTWIVTGGPFTDVKRNGETVAAYDFTVTGTGNFTGVLTGKFTITPKNISSASIVLADDTLTFNDSQQEAVISSVTLEGTKLAEPRDYTIREETRLAKEIGPYTLEIVGTGNYTGTATKDFTMQKAQLPTDEGAVAITLLNDLVYTGGEQEQKVSVAINGRLLDPSEYEIVSQDGKATNLGTNAGTYEMEIRFKNYEGTATKAFTIAKAEPDFTISGITTGGGQTTAPESAYEANQSVTLATAYTGESTAPAITFVSSDPTVATVDSDGKVTLLKAGTVTITATAAATDNYQAASAAVTFTVTRVARVLTVTDAAMEKTYGDDPFTISYTNSGDGEVAFSSDDHDVATVDESGQVTITGAGTATITLDAAETRIYQSAATTVTLTVKKKALTAAIAEYTKEYDRGTALAKVVGDDGETIVPGTLAATVSTGVDDEEITISGLSGTFSDANVGTGKPLTVNVRGVTLSGVAADENPAAMTTEKDANGQAAYVVLDTLANYTVKIPATATGTITKRAAYVMVYARTKTYNGTTEAELDKVQAENLLSGDTLTASASFTVAFTSKNADVNIPVNVWAGGTPLFTTTYDNSGNATETYGDTSGVSLIWGDNRAADNYEVVVKGAPGTIEPKVLKLDAAAAWSRPYAADDTSVKIKLGAATNDESDYAASVTNGDWTNEILADDQVTGIIGGIDDDSAGRRKVTLSLTGDDAGNYELEYSEFYVTISKVDLDDNDLTLSLDDWTYGETPKTPTVLDLSGNAAEGSIKYQYSADGGATWSYTVPTDAGSYQVRAVVSSENYNNKELTASFTIHQKQGQDVTETITYVPATAGEVKNLVYDLTPLLADTAAALSVLSSFSGPVVTAAAVSQNALRYTVKACDENETDQIVIQVAGTDNCTAYTITLDLVTRAVTTELPAGNALGENEVNDSILLAYDVKYWTRELNGTYTENTEYSGTQYAFQGSWVTPPVWNLEGFTSPTARTVRIVRTGQTISYYYSRESYDVAADLRGGTGDVPTSIPYGAVLSDTLPIPTRSGYTFNGWTVQYTDPSGAEKTIDLPADGGSAVMPAAMGEVIVTAKWTQAASGYVYVTYSSGEANDSTIEIPKQGVVSGDNVTLPANVWTYAEHDFAGWKAGGAAQVLQPGESLTVDADITLTALWNVKYTVTHEWQNLPGANETVAPDTYTAAETETFYAASGASVTSAVKAYAGFTAPAAQTATVAADGTTSITYQYTRNRYTLTKEPNGDDNGSGYGAQTLYYGQTLPTLSRTGYTFLGWFTEATGGTEITAMPAGDTTVYARWITGTRTGAAAVVNAPVGADTGIKGLGELDAAKTALENSLKAEMLDEAVKTDIGDATEVELKMTVDVYGDVGEKNYTEGQQALVNAVSAATSAYLSDAEAGNTLKLDFFDITVAKTLTTRDDNGVTSTETSEVTQTSSVIEITLDYDMTGKISPVVYRYHDGSAQRFARLLTQPTALTDGTFWCEEPREDGIVTFHIYSRKFSEYLIGAVERGSDDAYYTVTFDGAGGTVDDTLTYVKKGDTLSEAYFSGAKRPVKSGYTFSGWKDSEGAVWSAATAVTSDTALTAQWTVNSANGGNTGGGGTTYTVTTVDAETGTVRANATSAAAGETVTVTVTPRDGYEVRSVSVTDESGAEIVAARLSDGTYTFTMPESSVTVRAKFQKRRADPETTGVADWLICDEHPVYLHGYPDGRIGPTDNITRAEVARIFYNLLKNQDVEITVTFPDVQEGSWYAAAVNTLASLDVIAGYPDGTFGPERKITREEFAAMAARLAKASDGELTFTDVDPKSWAAGSIITASDYGWVEGKGDDLFAPLDPITRGEVAAIVNRMTGRAADQAYVTANADKLNQFPDLQDAGKWYYLDMVEASNEHDYTKTDGVEAWTK